ncbi:MAG: hypothetical protein LUH22_05110 [Bacteroides sp.]|nr:hypothetical protein [Bacteroides sp.]
MASRKQLKKNVNYITGELFAECMINASLASKENQGKVDEILSDILKMQDEFISRISHTEPGNVKVFYRKFLKDFNQEVDRIIDEIESLK